MAKITLENIRKIEIAEFERLLLVINREIIEAYTLILCAGLPPKSDNFIQKGKIGKGWNGFRKIDKAPINKLNKVIIEEVYNNKSNTENSIKSFRALMFDIIEIDPKFVDDDGSADDDAIVDAVIDSFKTEYIGTVLSLFGIQLTSKIKCKIEEKNKTELYYQEKLQDKQAELDNLQEKFDKLDKQFKEYKHNVKDIEQDANSRYSNLVKNVLTKIDLASNSEMIAKLNAVDKISLALVLRELNQKTSELYKQENYEEAKRNLLTEYILACLMEEN